MGISLDGSIIPPVFFVSEWNYSVRLPLSKPTMQKRGKSEITLLNSKYTSLSQSKKITKRGGFSAMT